MTTISAASSQGYGVSPLDRLKQELAAEISSGSVSASDSDALSSALDSIDSSLRQNQPSAGSAPPSPGDLQDKVSSLIDQQVTSGALTSDQASELRQVFANTFSGQGPGSAGGPPPGPPPSVTDSASDSDGSTTDTQTSIADLINNFLKQLQQNQTSGYDASAGSTNAGNPVSYLLNIQA